MFNTFVLISVLSFSNNLYCKNMCLKLLKPLDTGLPNVSFLTVFSVRCCCKSSHHMGQHIIMAQAERAVFILSLHSLFCTKNTCISSCRKKQLYLWVFLGCWSVDAVLHGNRPIVCMDEVMGLSGHQTQPE